jgi:hypothetical protein
MFIYPEKTSSRNGPRKSVRARMHTSDVRSKPVLQMRTSQILLRISTHCPQTMQ